MAVTVGNTTADGWSVITPSGTFQDGYNSGAPASGNTMMIYVANTGSDAVSPTEGSSTNPYATISHALSKIRSGQPDWLMLRAGDTWTGESFPLAINAGLDNQNPVVIAAYDPANPHVPNPGTGGARPIVKTPLLSDGLNYIGGPSYDSCLALMGIDFYSYNRDTVNNPTYDGSGNEAGFNWRQSAKLLLIEDCCFRFYSVGVGYSNVNSPNYTTGDLYIRRNVIIDQYCTAHHSGGIYMGDILTPLTGNITIEENVLDHNGWNNSVTGAELTNTNSLFNHNIYYQGIGTPGSGLANTPVLFRRNISSNGASGDQFRAGGRVIENLFVHSPIMHNMGAPASGSANLVDSNVCLEAIDGYTNLGWGFDTLYQYPSSAPNDYYDLGTIVYSNNIMAHSLASTGVGANGHGILITSGQAGCTVTNNIVYDWQVPWQDGGVGTQQSGNTFDATGATPIGSNSGTSGPSVGSYAGTVGLTATTQGFCNSARGQRRGTWRTDLMAAPVINYIRAGFGWGPLADSVTHRGGHGLRGGRVF